MCARFTTIAHRRKWGGCGTKQHSGLVAAFRDTKQTPPLSIGASRWRPTDPSTCSGWPLVARRRYWMRWGETYRDLFGATHGQSASACIVVEPHRTSALSVFPPGKLRASVQLSSSLRPQERQWVKILSQQVTTKKVGGKSFSQDVTSR